MLTQTELKEILDYDLETGVFTWKVCRGSRAKIGAVAGCLDKTTGYWQIRTQGKRYLAHRLAFLYVEGEFPPQQTDHTNHIRHDNRWCNLRRASRKENLRNQSLRKDNTSGVTGVKWHRKSGKWQAQIQAGGEVHLGLFDNLQDAALARKHAEIKYGFHKNHGK